MLQAFVITLREGLEAFLIVAISLSYLRQSGRSALIPAVRWGIGAAVTVSLLGGYLLYSAANQEALDGPLAVVAAASVSWMVVHMWRAGRRMKSDIEGHLRTSTDRTGTAAFMGVFLFTVLMVSREGMETALLLMQLRGTPNMLAGGLVGVAGAGALAWLWSRVGHRVNLSLFFQVTAIFLVVFVVQLLIKGVHESAEQHYLPWSDVLHARTESWGPDSPFGHFLTYMLVVLPLGWFTIQAIFSKGPVMRRPSPPKPSSLSEHPLPHSTR
jgi:high-affinity iron transporter